MGSQTSRGTLDGHRLPGLYRASILTLRWRVSRNRPPAPKERLNSSRKRDSALGFERVEQVEGVGRLHVLVHYRMYRLDHRLRRVGLEDVAPHINPGSALLHGVVGHRQRIELGLLLPARHDNRHRT